MFFSGSGCRPCSQAGGRAGSFVGTRVTRERRPVYGTAHIPALRPESRSPTAVPLMTREQTPALRRSLGEASHRGLLLGEDREAHHLKRVALRAGGLGAVNDVGDELGVVVKWHV